MSDHYDLVVLGGGTPDRGRRARAPHAPRRQRRPGPHRPQDTQTPTLDADAQTQLAICGAFAATRLSGGTWDQLSVAHAFTVVMRAVLAAFCSHPWAWNEIGFGGPAYPRGYMRTTHRPYRPTAFTLLPDLTIHTAYDGYW